MTFQEAMKSGMENELSKIAGFLRSGRRPFKALTLLKKGPKTTKKGSMVKMSVAGEGLKLPKGTGKVVAIAGLGALGYDQMQKAKRDYQTGRAMRLQQGY